MLNDMCMYYDLVSYVKMLCVFFLLILYDSLNHLYSIEIKSPYALLLHWNYNP